MDNGLRGGYSGVRWDIIILIIRPEGGQQIGQKLMGNEKPIFWVGASYKDLLSFPVGVKQEAGYQLHRIQNGLEPEDWKSVSTIGAGVKEIRIKEEEGIFRVLYVARLKGRIYVLHAFQKKTQKIRKQDRDIAKARYSAIAQEEAK